MLERGIAVRQGIGFLRTELPSILATRTDALSPRLLRVIEELAGDWPRQRAYPARSKHWPVKIRHVRA
jgi:transposase